MIKQTIKYLDVVASLREYHDETNLSLQDHDSQLQMISSQMMLLINEIKNLQRENDDLRGRMTRIEDFQITGKNHADSVDEYGNSELLPLPIRLKKIPEK